jgi:hypothetical protein
MNIPTVLKKFLGVALILMSLGFVARLILSLPILATQFSNAVRENLGYYWGEFTFTLLLNVLFWVVTYYMFRFGRKLFRSEY